MCRWGFSFLLSLILLALDSIATAVTAPVHYHDDALEAGGGSVVASNEFSRFPPAAKSLTGWSCIKLGGHRQNSNRALNGATLWEKKVAVVVEERLQYLKEAFSSIVILAVISFFFFFFIMMFRAHLTLCTVVSCPCLSKPWPLLMRRWWLLWPQIVFL